ncbi:MAG: hypothetical protein OFPI_12600 [Osedax symbiont Rs2]|nr:MAG: hypothetical protein OFPI_12600 [Osedax symbiont Rs2]
MFIASVQIIISELSKHCTEANFSTSPLFFCQLRISVDVQP